MESALDHRLDPQPSFEKTHSYERSNDATIRPVVIGVAIGAISALMFLIVPIIEHWADRLPTRRLGVFGTFLIFSGFLLESVERWLVLFDVPIR